MSEVRDAVLNTDLRLWGWEVALYLFLGGLAAGLLIFSGWAHLAGRRREYYPAVRVATLLAPPLIVAGLFFLWLDLGSKWRPFWLYLTFRPTSPMWWGSWVLLAVLVTSSLAAIPLIPVRGERPVRLLRRVGPRLRTISALNVGLGVALGIYTGVLLGTMVARPALNSPILGPLFLVSGMSAAAALIVMLVPGGSWGHVLIQAEVALNAVKLGLLGLYLAGLATSSAAGQTAAAVLASTGRAWATPLAADTACSPAAAAVPGTWAWAFWPFVIGAGVLIPLGVSTAEIITHHVTRKAAVLSGALVLFGGLALRFVLVYAGRCGL